MAMGKGLGALISDTGVAQENPTVVELKIIEVEPNKNQPRTLSLIHIYRMTDL